ncbi:MAG TPA: L,D-transpeptidase/peptidoglycan binding protein [Baekduia sp.]|nr:L,D-transpeptidase/peptidoglycan binding protein [Baekduia sp.]
MRRAPLLAILALGALVLAAAGVLLYDRSQRDVLAEGVRIGGVEVGGLERTAAVRRLEQQLVARLREPLRVDHGRKFWTLGAREARLSVDVAGSVDAALRHSREDMVLVRAWRSVTGGDKPMDVAPEVRYSKAAVLRMVDKVRKALDRAPKDADVRFTASGPQRRPGRTGLAVEASKLHADLRAAIVSATAPRRFVAQTRKVEPKVATEDLEDKYDTVLYVNRGAFKLTLYKRLKPVKTYGVAVGQVGLETPAGLYRIQNKAVNPAWTVPDSDWAGELAGRVIPGGVPENPLKARWLGVYDGVGVHGTSDEGSIGTNASHGCIRMRVAEIIELYPKVPVGAPIYIA